MKQRDVIGSPVQKGDYWPLIIVLMVKPREKKKTSKRCFRYDFVWECLNLLTNQDLIYRSIISLRWIHHRYPCNNPQYLFNHFPSPHFDDDPVERPDRLLWDWIRSQFTVQEN